MKVKTTISITDARKNIFKIADAVQKPGVYYTFTENGRPKAVLMSAEEFESWQETVEVMYSFPDLNKSVKETDKAIKSGTYKNWPNLDDVMAEYGYVFADNVDKKYGMEIKNKRKGKKRFK